MDNAKKTFTAKTSSFTKSMKKLSSVYRVCARVIAREESFSSLKNAADSYNRLSENMKRSLSSIRRFKYLPCCEDGQITAFSLSEGLARSFEHLNEQAIVKYMLESGKKYDSITLFLLPDFIFLALFKNIADCVAAGEDDGRLGLYLHAAERLRFIDFSRIFLMFSETDEIFSRERAGVYPDCDRTTKFSYISAVLSAAEKSEKTEKETALEILKEADGKNIHVGNLLIKRDRSVAKIYLHCLVLITFVLSLLYLFVCGLDIRAFIVLPGVVIGAYFTVKQVLSLCFKSAGNDALPRLCGERVRDERAVIAVMTILNGGEKDKEIFERIEDFYLSDENQMRFYAVVCNLPDAGKKTMPDDREIISAAKARVSALNAKYGEHFGIFVRERRYSRSEGKYIGWERKRGAVLEFCRFARGKKTSISEYVGKKDFLKDTRYLITLDSDTNLYSGASDELVGTMLHPLNRPKIKNGAVVSGHAVIQPHISPELESAAYSEFSSVTAGNGGIDSYSNASFDVYENVFGSGSFCGKGIIDIDVFLEVCDGFFPNERILSHDLLEGNLLGSAIASDITLTDATPKNALSYYTRQHRWIRGDLQTVPYLCGKVKNAFGDTVENPMDALSKYKIFENLLSAASPFFSVLAMFLCALFLSEYSFVSFLFLFSYLLFPIAHSFFASLLCGNIHMAGRRFHARVMPHLLGTFAYSFYKICAAAYEAYLFVDAAVRTFYRFFVSKRNFLNWKTAAAADEERNGIFSYLSKMWFSPIFGLLCLFLSSHTMKLLGILWIVFPFFAYVLSAKRKEKSVPSGRAKEKIRTYALAMWGYFRDFVNESTNFLPPDNYEISPVERVAYRTSPTNIGLYLASLVGARDLSLITSEELYSYASGTARSLSSMLKWRGHLYNWYDIKTLSVIGQPFISTVDSGNFVCALSAFCEGIKEYVFECPRLIDTLNFYEELIRKTEFSALYDSGARLFYIGYDVKNEKYSDSYYDTFMSEARMTSFFSVARGDVPREHFFAPARPLVKSGGYTGVASWSGTVFEYFMPALFLPVVSDSLCDEALAFAFYTEKRNSAGKEVYGKKRMIFGVSESGYFGFDSEMNYQYRAFGLSGISLDPACRNAKTFSPYSSFLMMRNGVFDCLSNLSVMEKLGAYGEYGFYEAVDFEEERVGKGYAVIKSYMAHHIGMSFISSVNLLKDDVFVSRFMKNPKMRASRELLCEKIAVGARAVSPSSKRERENKPRRIYVPSADEKRILRTRPDYNILFPDVAMLSNNKTRIVASSSGHIKVFNGARTLFYSEFSRFSLGSGIRFYAVADGYTLPLVPLEKRNPEFTSDFCFYYDGTRIVYTARHINGEKTINSELVLSVSSDSEMFSAQIKISGGFSSFFAYVYAEPVLDIENAFLSHKSFSNLFIESEYHEDEDALIFKRRPKSGKGDENYLGVRVFPDFDGGAFDTKRDVKLRLMYDEGDISALALSDFENSEGAMIVPMLSMRSGFCGKREKCVFSFASSSSEDEILFMLSSPSRNDMKRFADVMRLQYGASGVTREFSFAENFILRSFCFGKNNVSPVFYKKIPRDVFWKRGISGENPLLLLKMRNGDDGEFSVLSSILCIFKYMCIRGIRFDAVVIYPEKDFYRTANSKRTHELIISMGCGNFLGRDNGIFPISEEELSKEEISFFEFLCDAYIDLSLPLSHSCAKNNNCFEISQKANRALLSTPVSGVMHFELPIPDSPVAKISGGYFTDGGFFIEKPHGNIPYTYVIASEKFGSVLSENSLGFSYYENSFLGKLTPHLADNMREDSGEKLILRVYDEFGSGDYFDFDMVSCSQTADFSNGRARYGGKICGIAFKVDVRIDERYPVKVISVSFEHEESKKAKISVFFAAKPCLYDKPLKNNSYIYTKEKNAVFVSSAFENRMELGVLCRGKATGAYTDFTAFLSDGHLFSGIDDVACVCSFPDAREDCVCFFLGAISDAFARADFCAFCDSYVTKDMPPHEIFGKIEIKTDLPVFDLSVNFLFPYQTLYSRFFARSGFYQVGGAYGFRDQLQDSLSFIDTCPSLCREHILRCASHQYAEGDVPHWWHEYGGKEHGLRTRYSDDLLFLPFVTYEYVKRTGDTVILDENVPYLDSPILDLRETERYEELRHGKSASLYEHLLSATYLSVKRGTGANSLMKILGGDWNDGMNFVGAKGKGESVWLTEFASVVFFGMSYICEIKKDSERAEYFHHLSLSYLENAKREFFDGWYIRGYYDDGRALGKRGNSECEIDSLPQSFAAFAENIVCGNISENTRTALDFMTKKLFDRDNGIFLLLSPAFDTGSEYPGYIKGYIPGIRENGGQYTHAAVWAAMALLISGKKKEGTEVLLSINPALMSLEEEFDKRYRAEPYALAGDVYSNPDCTGRGGWSFYTGSAAWYRIAVIEVMFGYIARKDGFYLRPNMTEIFDGATMNVNLKGTFYKIRFTFSDKCGIVVDDRIEESEEKSMKNHFFPFDGKKHVVDYCMKK